MDSFWEEPRKHGPEPNMLDVPTKTVEKMMEMPEIKSSMSLSKDKQWIIHKTVITDIKHVNYLKAMFRREDRPRPRKHAW